MPICQVQGCGDEAETAEGLLATDVIRASGYLASICDRKVRRSDRGDFHTRNGILNFRIVPCKSILMFLKMHGVALIAQKQKSSGDCTTSMDRRDLPGKTLQGFRSCKMNAGSAIFKSIHLGEPTCKIVTSPRLPVGFARSLADGESIQSVGDTCKRC